MSEIKQILDEIASTQGNNAKKDVLKKYADNELLKEVLYNASSKRVKFYVKQIPEYPIPQGHMGLDNAIQALSELSERKRTGHDAVGFLVHLFNSVSVDDAYVLERIIEKDLKIGLGKTFINQVIPNLIEKTPYMGAKSYSQSYVDKILKSGKAISQIKMDGMYANGEVGDTLNFVSRAGEPTYIEGARFLQELENLGENLVFNGELTIHDVPERRTANGIIRSLVDIQKKREERTEAETQKKVDAFLKKHAKDYGREVSFQEVLDSIVYTCWDVITEEEYVAKKSTTPYHERLENLKQILEDKNPEMIELVETKIVTSYDEAMEHFLDALDRGLEGTILKAYDGEWKDGKPTWQVKMKLEMNIDLKVIGFEYGEKGTKNENWISTINLESSCGLLKTNASNMPESLMQEVTDNQEEYMGKIVEIKCCGLSQNKDGDWSTLHPSVVEIRHDKDTCDSLESAKEIEEAVKGIVKS
jgi:ATP-dependent DNA ligase